MSKKCSTCGADNPDRAKKCHICGSEFVADKEKQNNTALSDVIAILKARRFRRIIKEYRKKKRHPFSFMVFVAILSLIGGTLYLLLDFFIIRFYGWYSENLSVQQQLLLIIFPIFGLSFIILFRVLRMRRGDDEKQKKKNIPSMKELEKMSSKLIDDQIKEMIEMKKLEREKQTQQKSDEDTKKDDTESFDKEIDKIETDKTKTLLPAGFLTIMRNDIKHTAFPLLLVTGYYIFFYILSYIDILPVLSDEKTGFKLIIANTLLGILLAFLYDGRSLSIVSLLGGALIPYFFYSNISPGNYFLLLWMLIIAIHFTSLYLESEFIRVLNFLTAVFIVQYDFFVSAIYGNLSLFHLALCHPFAYLFIFLPCIQPKSRQNRQKLSLFKKIYREFQITLKNKFTSTDVFIIITTISLFLYNIYYYFKADAIYTDMGIVYLFNVFPFAIILAFMHSKFSKQMLLLLYSIAGVLLVAAINALFRDRIMISVFVGTVITLSLIYIGFNFKMPRVRFIAYLLFAILILRILITFTRIPLDYHEILFTDGYFNLLSIGIIFIVLLIIFDHYRFRRKSYENVIFSVINQAVSFWLVIMVILTAWHQSYRWMAFIGFIPAFYLIYRGYKANLQITKYIGYIFVAFLCGYSLLIAYSYMKFNFERNLFSYGYINFLGTGMLLFLLKYWYPVVNSIRLKGRKLILQKASFIPTRDSRIHHYHDDRAVRLLHIFFSFWLTSIFLITLKYIAPGLISFLCIIPALYFLYIGYINRNSFDKWFGYIIYFTALAYITYMAIDHIFKAEISGSLLDFYYYQLQFIIYILSLLFFQQYIYRISYIYSLKTLQKNTLYKKYDLFPLTTIFYDAWFILKSIMAFRFGYRTINLKRPVNYHKFQKTLLNSISFWFAVVFFVSFRFYLKDIDIPAPFLRAFQPQNLVFAFLPIPMFALIFWGGKQKLIVSEFLGFLHYAIMGFAVIWFMISSGSFRLVHQTFATVMVICEMYIILWLLHPFYESMLPNSPRLKYMAILKNTFYFFFSAIVVYIASKAIGEYINYAFWFVVVISFMLTELTKNKSILFSFYAWTLVAAVSSFKDFEYIAIGLGLIILWSITAYKKGILRQIEGKIHYNYLGAITYLYSGFFLGIMYSLINKQEYSAALFLSSAFFIALVYFRQKIFAVRISYIIVYRLAYIFTIAGFIYFFTDSSAYSYTIYKLLSLVFMLTTFFFFHKVIYGIHTDYPGIMHTELWRLELIALHLFYVAGYIALLTYLVADIEQAWKWILGIMVSHSIVIFINSRKKKFDVLARFALVIFSAALLALIYMAFQYLNQMA